MSYVRDNTTTGTKAADIYGDLATELTANGWTQVGTAITVGGVDWNIWKNPLANSGLSKDFHVAIGHATTGDGDIRCRLFEDWTGVSNRVTRWAPRRVGSGELTLNTGVYEDSYGDALTAYSSHCYPIPWSPGNGDYARAGGDGSVGAYDSQNSQSGTDEEGYLDSAPNELHFASEYIGEHLVQTDDDTAAEYVIHVNEHSFMFVVKRIFDNAIRGIYVGEYEPTHTLDPMPIAMFPLQTTLASQDVSASEYNYTRFWGYDGIPSMGATVQNVEATISWGAGSMDEYTYNGALTIVPDYGLAPVDDRYQYKYFDSLAQGAVLSRVMCTGSLQSQYMPTAAAPRAILYGPLIGFALATGATPLIQVGDEITVNGSQYIFAGCLTTYGLDDGGTSPSSNGDTDPIFFPKS